MRRKRRYQKPKTTRWTSYVDGGFRYGRWDDFGKKYVRSAFNETDYPFHVLSPYRFWKDSLKFRRARYGR